jgi:hypothetical protein
MVIAAENGVNRKTVRLWRGRFRGGGPQALWEIAPGRGRKPSYDVTRIKAVIDATLQTKPKGSTHWSCRSMAAAQGISKSSVSRIWRSHNLAASHKDVRCHASRFLEKTHGCGRSLSESLPTRRLCFVDGRAKFRLLCAARIAAEEGRCGTMTHTTSDTDLFAALDVLLAKSATATSVTATRSF